MHDARAVVVEPHFDTAGQQRLASQLGIWTFLATELMFFGGLFTAYTIYRVMWPALFARASAELFMWIGAINTAVLLCSSFTMALAVHAHKQNRQRRTARLLLATAALGAAFLALKALEYFLDYREETIPGAAFNAGRWSEPGKAAMFFVLYFLMTGLHAAHVLIGVLVLTVSAWLVRAESRAARRNLVESVGLYWHFVDIVWLFLFPLLYLVGVR